MRACYDLARNPPTYDVVAFLMAAEAERIRRGDEGIEIEIAPGPKRGFADDRLWPPLAQREAMMAAIVLPMMRMLPSATGITRPLRRPQDGFGLGQWSVGLQVILAAMKAGVRPLRLPDAPRPDPRLVTITLREAEHWPARNSRLVEWRRAAATIRDRGFEIVFVRDSVKAEFPLDGFATDPAASQNLNARARLYLSAACNLFVSNGPAWFALALDAPVLMLRPTTEGVGRHSGGDHFRRCGLDPGRQIDGAPQWQRLAWEPDDEAAIVAAFDGVMTSAAVCERAA